ncbi:PucR family transcriptional regulator [Effusibacillus pohliae]|uniref:PucR family transcriptional regulator n=1 Tax=Effusibacillus pohliae TaxID=232270 RepID=UPI0003622D22|nr:helix-turn-helix domain-containing protein [Effusibacillus pohliae]
MDCLRELQKILGDRVRFEQADDAEADGRRSFVRDSEEWIPIGNGRYAVVDLNRLSDETAKLVRLLIETVTGGFRQPHDEWFPRLIHGEWDAGRFANEALARRWNIPLPGVVAILQLHGEDAEAALALLEEIFSDREWNGLTDGGGRRVLLYLPLQAEESVGDVQQIGSRLLDTLQTEIYVSGNLAVSRPVRSLQELPSAKRQAEIALQAGRSFHNGQKIYQYGQLGLAQLLYGVSEEAKAAFLQEVLPREKHEALTRELRETVHSFAQHAQNIAETARALYIHRNTLLYRLDKIQEVTGKDIRKFRELAELWIALILRNEKHAQKSDGDFV